MWAEAGSTLALASALVLELELNSFRLCFYDTDTTKRTVVIAKTLLSPESVTTSVFGSPYTDVGSTRMAGSLFALRCFLLSF